MGTLEIKIEIIIQHVDDFAHKIQKHNTHPKK